MFDIKKLTLKQKIGQLCQGVLSTATEEDITALVKEGRLGSCILADNSLAGNSKQRKASPELVNRVPVSYTHLDVYKRQVQRAEAVSFLT